MWPTLQTAVPGVSAPHFGEIDVLAGVLGLDTNACSISYVAGWAGGDIEMIQGSAANVLRAVHQLAAALIEDDTPAAEAA